MANKDWTETRLLLLLANFYWHMRSINDMKLCKRETGKEIKRWFKKYKRRETFKTK